MGKAPEKGINRKLKRDKALARQPAPPRRYALAAVSVGMLALCMGVVLASSRPPKASNTPPPVQPGPPETPNTEKADWQDHMKQESQREKERQNCLMQRACMQGSSTLIGCACMGHAKTHQAPA
eukprot:1161311-Pelagomonas_calceolata.AAC.11